MCSSALLLDMDKYSPFQLMTSPLAQREIKCWKPFLWFWLQYLLSPLWRNCNCCHYPLLFNPPSRDYNTIYFTSGMATSLISGTKFKSSVPLRPTYFYFIISLVLKVSQDLNFVLLLDTNMAIPPALISGVTFFSPLLTLQDQGLINFTILILICINSTCCPVLSLNFNWSLSEGWTAEIFFNKNC